MHYAKRGNDGGLIEELDEVIANLDPDEDGHFTLLLGHNYTEKSIVDLGFRAFKGIDRARVGVLEGANTALPTDKQLKLYIAKLSHDISYDSRSHVDGHVNSIGWYSMAGDALGSTRSSSATLNFLNPSRETLLSCGCRMESTNLEGTWETRGQQKAEYTRRMRSSRGQVLSTRRKRWS